MSTMTSAILSNSSVLEKEAGAGNGGVKKMASSATILSPIMEQKAVIRDDGDDFEEKEGRTRSIGSRTNLPIWKGGDVKT